MTKYVFWSLRHDGASIALTENLHRYAQGKTAWQALQHLCETLEHWSAAADNTETPFQARLKMFQETGIHKIEVFVDHHGSQYQISSAGVRSTILAESEREALLKYLDIMAANSLQNERGAPPL